MSERLVAMLFIVNELQMVYSKNDIAIEFRESCEHVLHQHDMSGYAFRVYDKHDMVYFTKEWLAQIKRSCEVTTFKTISDVVNRYNDYISRGGEPIVFDEASVRHGKIYSYMH
jgi:hypothetical protein